MGPRLQALFDEAPRGEQRTVDVLVELNRMVQQRVSYVVRMEPGVWTPEETLAAGQGSCRDSAWLLVQLLRHLGFAARFVSGYLIQLVADVKPLDGPEGPKRRLHRPARLGGGLPAGCWLDRPRSYLWLARRRGPYPTGRHARSTIGGPDQRSGRAVRNRVRLRHEADARARDARASPSRYTEAQWQDILAMGAAVDRSLLRGDIRLTMGGEPTFVSAIDFEAPEWTTDALGPTKQRLASQLMRRLQPLWSPGAALQNVFGKHYPGEQLPRWALYSHWRADGEPIWRDPALFAEDDDNEGATAADAARFCAALAERLQVDPSLVQPAYEDIHYYLWREHRLPANVLADGREARRSTGARAVGACVRPRIGSARRQRAAAPSRAA